MKIYLTRTPMDSENNKVFYTNPVEASQASLRIDKYIAGEIRDFSRAQVQRLIEEGFVFADDEVILDKNHKTRIGDVYQVNLPEPKEAAPQAENIPLDILYEDSDLIVVNKPAGMTVHPAAGVYTGTLVNALLYHCRNSLSGIGGVARPGIVHRIDRNTSGILVAAKNDIAHRGLAEQFFYHTIERTYYAVVYGIPSPEQGTITGNIARSPYDRKKMAIVQNGGKTATTHYKTIETYKKAAAWCNAIWKQDGHTKYASICLLSVAIWSATMYIQKQKKSTINLPEPLKSFVNTFPRQALHAYSLGFEHPINHQRLSFTADFPEDMQNLIENLRVF